MLEREDVADDRVREILETGLEVYGDVPKLKAVPLCIPELLHVKGLVEDPEWYETFFHLAMQWPASCVLKEKTCHLIGLAKSIAYLWKPGVVAHWEYCRRAGATQEEISEVVKVSSLSLGLGNLETAVDALAAETMGERQFLSLDEIEDPRILKLIEDAKEVMGEVPDVYLSRIVTEDAHWLEILHDGLSVIFHDGPIDPKTKHLICIAVHCITRWQQGVRRHTRFALQSGATSKEIADVIKSSFKTAVSMGTQAGYSTPCFTPESSGGSRQQ
jgi:AhpD family alkylhydroperoxidase